MEYRVNLKLSFRLEGYGIYVLRKQKLQQAGQEIAQRTTWIEMLGYRNGTQLAFETGTLNAAKSTSKFPGFWESFEKAANAAGVSVTEYGVLLQALESRQSEQYSVAKGKTIDFSSATAQVEAAYLAALDSHFNDHLIPDLAAGKGDVILAGGAAHLMREALWRYFEERGFSSRLSFAWDNQEALTRLVEAQLPEAHEISLLPMPMTDGCGLFQALLGEMNRMQVAS